jgi:glutamyl-tRNA synthetase
MPRWAHLPLILKPDGNGKLSKRDGDRLGFPVFAMNWKDPNSGETTKGFREMGFLPEAFLNLLVMLGWHKGTDQEIFTLEELIESFSLERVHKGGARFDFEKAKWFNHEWIKKLPVTHYQDQVQSYFQAAGIDTGKPGAPRLGSVLDLVRDRCHLLTDFVQQSSFFFVAPNPADIDLAPVRAKWNEAKQQFFVELIRQLQFIKTWDALTLDKEFKEMAAAASIKPGDLLLPLRLMLVGGKFGPGVFDIAALLGPEETIHRIKQVLGLLQS